MQRARGYGQDSNIEVPQPVVKLTPVRPAVGAFEYTTARDSCVNNVGISRVNYDGGHVGAVVNQAGQAIVDRCPACATIGALEKPSKTPWRSIIAFRAGVDDVRVGRVNGQQVDSRAAHANAAPVCAAIRALEDAARPGLHAAVIGIQGDIIKPRVQGGGVGGINRQRPQAGGRQPTWKFLNVVPARPAITASEQRIITIEIVGFREVESIGIGGIHGLQTGTWSNRITQNTAALARADAIAPAHAAIRTLEQEVVGGTASVPSEGSGVQDVGVDKVNQQGTEVSGCGSGSGRRRAK